MTQSMANETEKKALLRVVSYDYLRAASVQEMQIDSSRVYATRELRPCVSYALFSRTQPHTVMIYDIVLPDWSIPILGQAS